jgi:transglutaminase-like putative cysteine protease/predicted Zn-dependent protease
MLGSMRSTYVQRWLVAAATLLLALPALAADWRDAPPFSLSAKELQQAAAAVTRERPVDIVVMLDERSYVFDEQHRLTTTVRMIYRVDSPAGVENWAASSAHWQPWYQARPEIRARVITRDGREHLLDQNLLRDAARTADNQVYDDSHVLEGPLPAIAVGAVIEEQIVVRDEKPFFAAGVAYREYIGRPVPVLHTRMIIDAPESLPLKRTTRLLPDAEYQETRANGRVRWVLEQDTIDEQDAMDANLPYDKPGWASVEFSTARSWEAVAANYLIVTEPRIREDDARPLIAGLRGASGAGRQEFIARVVERLHREVRYTGVEFGEARLVPEYPRETLRRKFGDCKDKSTLLVAALRAAGIEAYLALLSSGTGQDVSPDLPGLGMFNHAIVYVPKAGANGKDIWIDATTEYARVGTLPTADADRLALVIRAGEKALVRTPVMRSTDNAQIETREFFLAEHGPARVLETTETHGTVELEYRSWYAGADTKERLDSLREYAQSAYRAKALSNYTHTSSTDFSRFYSMTLDIKEAPVGSTDLNSAAVGINLGNIITRLPSYFSEQIEDGGEADLSRRDDVVFEPYVIEWRYVVHPADGFRPRALPMNSEMTLGPAKLTSEFTRDDKGLVRATWRFDTVKGRYTPAESAAFVKAVRDLKERQVMLLSFDHEGAARRAEGDYKGALEAYRTLVARHPKQSMHRVRHAYALLEAGLGTRAQEEALAATRLDPKNAYAWKSLGWMLQHDAVGRRFGAGFDRSAAIAAYLKARALDSGNTDIAADLGVLYEHDANGVRYADEDGLELAIIEYRKRAALLEADEQKSDRYIDNLYYSLLYLHRFAELRDAIRKETSTASRRALHLAAVAGADGSARAIDAGQSLINSDSDRRSAYKSAAGLLSNLREYALAADLLEAASRGQSTTAADSQRISLLRKVRKGARESAQVTDARSVVLKVYALLLSSDRQLEGFQKLVSRHFQPQDGIEAQYDSQRRGAQAVLARQDAPPDVSADLLFANMRVTVEGDDARGYRAQLRNAGLGTNYFVVKEDGTYKLLAKAPFVAPLAEAALARLDTGDEAGARQWLDWARLEQDVSNSEDPLNGYNFSRFWRPGGKQDAADMRTAAALLLADSWQSKRALPLLLAARGVARTEDEKLSIELALGRAYQDLEKWAELEEVITPLAANWPDSALAFHLQQWSRIKQGKWDTVTAVTRERLARQPDDLIARRVQVEVADARGAAREMAALMKPVIEGPRATAGDYNEYAWMSLMQLPVNERVVEIARQAFDETEGNDNSISHTLACVYAAAGKPREARDLLLRGLSRNSEEPNDSAWYGFGLVAEAYGDVESARDYYARVSRPKDTNPPASSLFSMSQQRLRALR